MKQILEKLNGIEIPKNIFAYRLERKNDIKEEYKTFQQVEYLAGIIDLIAYCESRVNREINYCVKRIGYNENGKLMGSETEIDTIKRFTAISKRLKGYYNFKVSQLKKYRL